MRLTIFYLIHHKIPIINHSMNCPSKADDVKNRRQVPFFYNPTKSFLESLAQYRKIRHLQSSGMSPIMHSTKNSSQDMNDFSPGQRLTVKMSNIPYTHQTPQSKPFPIPIPSNSMTQVIHSFPGNTLLFILISNESL